MLEWKCYGNDWLSWLSDWNVARSFKIVQVNVHWWQQNIQCWYSLLDWIGWKGFTQNWKTIALRFDACGNPVIVILLKWDVMNEVGQIAQDFQSSLDLSSFRWLYRCFTGYICQHEQKQEQGEFSILWSPCFFSSCERDDAVRGEDLAENIFFFPTHHFLPVKATRQLLGWNLPALAEG